MFTDLPAVADGASEVFVDVLVTLTSTPGRRWGVITLLLNAPVEVKAIRTVR